MGDRYVVGFVFEDRQRLYFYSHHDGENWPENLASALHAASSRWHDDSYATRVVTSQLIGNEWRSTTGYGLSPSRLWGDHDMPVVDWNEGTVTVHPVDDAQPPRVYSLPEFITEHMSVTLAALLMTEPLAQFIAPVAQFTTSLRPGGTP